MAHLGGNEMEARDLFAAAALAGQMVSLKKEDIKGNIWKELAENSYRAADAMLKEKRQVEPQKLSNVATTNDPAETPAVSTRKKNSNPADVKPLGRKNGTTEYNHADLDPFDSTGRQ